MTTCTVCQSPYKTEVEALLARGASVMEVSEKYHGLFQNSRANLYNKLNRHTRNKHNENGGKPGRPRKEKETIGLDGEITFAEYEKKLLRAAMMDDDMFTGKKISHAAVIAAKRASIEEAKAKTQESALKFAMVSFLRGEGAKLPDGTDKLIESNTD